MKHQGKIFGTIQLVALCFLAFASRSSVSALRSGLTHPIEYGNRGSWWTEYPSGLVDLTRTTHLQPNQTSPPPLNTSAAFELLVNNGTGTVRISRTRSAYVIIDMQNYFLNPALINHPGGLATIPRILNILPVLRSLGVKILWVNWGLTQNELSTIPPAQVRGFEGAGGNGSFGAELPYNFGRLLMRNQLNSQLYGPLQDAYLAGAQAGTDVFIYKNRLSGMWGPETLLDIYLQQTGIDTLLFAGVNTDQCVLGTGVDAYYKGYDSILVTDTTATTSPPGGYENVVYNFGGFGFTTNSSSILMLANSSTSG